MSKYPTLSVCMIVKNEEENLPVALASVRGVADELIVVDTGSKDRTVEIARRFGAKVFHFDWCDDFSAARNESLRHATKDYIMWLDGDDEFQSNHPGELREVLKMHRGKAFHFLVQLLFENRKDEYYQVRLFPRRKDILFEGRVHEQPNYSLRRSGIPTLTTQLRIVHHGYNSPDNIVQKLERNLKILEAEQAEKKGDIIVRFFRARTNMGLHRVKESETLYKEIIEDAKKDRFFRTTEYWRMSYLDLINVLAAQCSYGDAKTYIADLKNNFGADFFSYYFLGNVLMREGNYPDALKELAAAERADIEMGIFPVNKPQMLAELHAHAGFCCAKEGQRLDAIEYATKALKECGTDPHLLDSISDTFMILRDPESLTTVLSKMAPGTGKYHYKKGMYHIYRGHMADAASELETALMLGQKTRNCLSALMLCYEELRLLDKATALASEWRPVFDSDSELSKRLLTIYIDTCRYEEASGLLDRLNGQKDIEMKAADIYIAALKEDWEKMLACSLDLFQALALDKEPSLEDIIRLGQELLQKNEKKAALYMQQSIGLFAAKSPS
ncbi:MAG: glycosyltransferase [Proteobacteria bacterium]|nr:glycosyltransferase [Pseudomonadota bacterium]